VSGATATSACGQSLFVSGVFLVVGLCLLVVGGRLVQHARDVNRHQGGWRTYYARHLPSWTGVVTAIVFLVIAAVRFSEWGPRCLNEPPSAVAVALAALAVGVAIANVVMLIASRYREDQGRASVQPHDETTAPVEEMNRGDAPRLAPRLRRLLWRYAAISALAIVLALTAYAVR